MTTEHTDTEVSDEGQVDTIKIIMHGEDDLVMKPLVLGARGIDILTSISVSDSDEAQMAVVIETGGIPTDDEKRAYYELADMFESLGGMIRESLDAAGK